MQERINKEIIKNAPSDVEMRMKVLGFTPLTVAGFALSAVLICCNILLGTGWAGDLIFGPEQTEPPNRLSSAPVAPSSVLSGDERTVIGVGVDLDPLVLERLLEKYHP